MFFNGLLEKKHIPQPGTIWRTENRIQLQPPYSHNLSPPNRLFSIFQWNTITTLVGGKNRCSWHPANVNPGKQGTCNDAQDHAPLEIRSGIFEPAVTLPHEVAILVNGCDNYDGSCGYSSRNASAASNRVARRAANAAAHMLSAPTPATSRRKWLNERVQSDSAVRRCARNR